MEWRVCQSWHSPKIFVWTTRQMKWQQTTKRWADTAKADLPTNDKGKLGDSWKKKLEILQKVHEILFFPYRDLGRGGNKYLLKYYLVLCLVQFYLLPSPLGNPGTSPALQAREWGIVWSSPVLGGRGVGQIKKNLLFDFAKYQLFLAWFTRWLWTSRLHIFKKNAGPNNLSESGWRGIIYQN